MDSELLLTDVLVIRSRLLRHTVVEEVEFEKVIQIMTELATA